ncbi:phage tail protein I [Aestuariirhabdus haliotis]|uniref:phage tail protein I n=1 Tax=Aestuariirhabdus haliotis TaxID=2918751 RepID=UPI0020BF537C|nr:phage tail protein I [Aestuariirhabdus haliotis]MCL6419422.1 phage tail protein I [Aestuariirhabdus haliotis]
MNKSLLPFNATYFERHVEQVTSKTEVLPVPIKTVWNPTTCPEELLPWLAWALSVDNWNSDWPTAVKREQIANSIEIHRRKGTVLAVKQAMAVFGVAVELKEWFEFNGPPHTFSVMAWVGDNFSEDAHPVLTEDYYRSLKHAIDYSKPVRSHYQFKVGVLFGGGFSIATAHQIKSYIRAEGEMIFSEVQLDGAISVAGANQTHSVTRINMEL